jgi:hypothetical protein
MRIPTDPNIPSPSLLAALGAALDAYVAEDAVALLRARADVLEILTREALDPCP